MTIDASSSQTVLTAVREAIEHHGATRDALIPILSDVNRKLGYLPVEALQLVGRELHEPASQLNAVATFYSMLSTKPRGRHVVQFCESAPCHVVGGRDVWHTLQDALKLQPGETSADGKWTLETTSCLGLCAVGPVFIVDNDMYGNVEPEKIPEILARYA